MARLRRTRRCFAVALIPAVAALVAWVRWRRHEQDALARPSAPDHDLRVFSRAAPASGARFALHPSCDEREWAPGLGAALRDHPRAVAWRGGGDGSAADASAAADGSSADGAGTLALVCPDYNEGDEAFRPEFILALPARSAARPYVAWAYGVQLDPCTWDRAARPDCALWDAALARVDVLYSNYDLAEARLCDDARGAMPGVALPPTEVSTTRGDAPGAFTRAAAERKYTACSLATLHHGWFGSRRERERSRARVRALFLPLSLSLSLTPRPRRASAASCATGSRRLTATGRTRCASTASSTAARAAAARATRS